MAELKRTHRIRASLRAPRSRVLLIVVAAVAVVFLVGSVLTAQLGREAAKSETDIVADQRDATAAQAVEAVSPVLELCAENSPVGMALQEDPRNPCRLAQQVKASPVAPPAEARDEDKSPTSEQISRAVADYLIQHPPAPGVGPTPAEVAAAAAAWLADNPPAPGRPPTAAEIAGAVQTYYLANPPPAGERGPGPTDAEIRAAVAEYLAANPPPAGRDGDNGVDGAPAPSVQSETRTYSDGSVERCVRTSGPDSDPVFTCGITPPPAAPSPDPADPPLLPGG